MKFSVNVAKFSKITLKTPLFALSIHKGTYFVASCIILFKLKIIAAWMFCPQKGEEEGTGKWKKKKKGKEKGEICNESFEDFLISYISGGVLVFCLFYLNFSPQNKFS